MSFIPEDVVAIKNDGRGIITVTVVTEKIGGQRVTQQPYPVELEPGEHTGVFLYPTTVITIVPKTIEVKETIMDRKEYHR